MWGVEMRKLGVLLSLVMVLGVAGRAMAVSDMAVPPIWSEEAAAPISSARWGVCPSIVATPYNTCNGAKFGEAPNIAAATTVGVDSSGGCTDG